MAQIDAFVFKNLTLENKVSNLFINKLCNQDLLRLLLDSSVETEVKNAIIQFIIDIKLDDDRHPVSRGGNYFSAKQSIDSFNDALHTSSDQLLSFIIDLNSPYEKRVIAAKVMFKRMVPPGKDSKAVIPQNLEPFKRFNWGAFMLPIIWSGAYSQWGWFFLLMLLNLMGGIVVGLVDKTGNGNLIYIAFMLYLSYLLANDANKLAWEKKAGKFKTVENLLKAQTKWIYWGVPITIIRVGFIIASFIEAVSYQSSSIGY